MKNPALQSLSDEITAALAESPFYFKGKGYNSVIPLLSVVRVCPEERRIEGFPFDKKVPALAVVIDTDRRCDTPYYLDEEDGKKLLAKLARLKDVALPKN